jgi:hypothetical protein
MLQHLAGTVAHARKRRVHLFVQCNAAGVPHSGFNHLAMQAGVPKLDHAAQSLPNAAFALVIPAMNGPR